MGDAENTFAQARVRLEDIVSQVRKKDMSLESSLDLLEEGVRLANACTEQIDQSEWRTVAEDAQAESQGQSAESEAEVLACGEEAGQAEGGETEPASQQ